MNGSGRFSDITEDVLAGLRKLSLSYIWFTGVIEHSTYPESEVKGLAGSPYAIKDYADVNSYLSDNSSHRIEEFKSMLKRVHRAGMGAIIDLVPNHVSCNYDPHSEIKFDDSNFYPGRYHDGDWTDTVKLNYGNHDTWEKMLQIILLWCSRGVDGFRCDMVELVPIEFWRWCLPIVREHYPSIIFIAEVYQINRYREHLEAGFDYLYDKSGFYDTLFSVIKWGASASSFTSAWQSIGDLQPQMLNFMENHDEVRISSPAFAGNPLKGLPAVFTSLLFNDAPFMVYFGQEFGEDGMESAGYSGPDGRTTIYDWWSSDKVSRWLKGISEKDEVKYLTAEEKKLLKWYRSMLKTAVSKRAFRDGGSYDLQYVNPHSERYNPDIHYAFLRSDGKKLYLCCANFAETDADVTVSVPEEAFHHFGVSRPDSRISANIRRLSGIVLELK